MGSKIMAGRASSPTLREIDKTLGRGKERRAFQYKNNVEDFVRHILETTPNTQTSETPAEIEANLITIVRDAIREKLPNLVPGQGLGIVFRIEILDDASPTDRTEWADDVKRRDGHMCQECGTHKNPQAHHIKAWADAPHLRLDRNNGITLCRECHAAQHDARLRGLILNNAAQRR